MSDFVVWSAHDVELENRCRVVAQPVTSAMLVVQHGLEITISIWQQVHQPTCKSVFPTGEEESWRVLQLG